MPDTLTGQLTWVFETREAFDLALINVNLTPIYSNVQADPNILTITATLTDPAT